MQAMKSRNILLYIFIPVFILFTNCKSLERGRKGALPARYSLEMEIEDRIKRISDFPDRVLISNSEFRITGETQNSGRFTFYMEKENNIFCSVRFLGFEVIRAEITRDSIKYINRFRKQYLFDDLEKMNQNLPLPLSFDDLQRFIFTGIIYRSEKDINKFFKSLELRSEQIYYNNILAEGKKIELIYSRDGILLNTIIIADYINDIFGELSVSRKDNETPGIIIGELINEGKSINIQVVINEIENHNYTKTDFKIGRNYTRIEKLF